MAELADVQDLGSCAERRAGSTPVTRTSRQILQVSRARSYVSATYFMPAKETASILIGLPQNEAAPFFAESVFCCRATLIQP